MPRPRFDLRPVLISIATVAGLAVPARAADDASATIDMLFGNQPVEVASRRGERAATAPAVVRVYTREEIRELGLRTLSDVIRITPGFTMVTDIDDLVIGTRGIVTDNNSKFVVLLDGHNLTSTFNNGVNPNHVFPMSLENVARIEVLTGPGSTLWGSGALLGVFNIVTEDADTLVGADRTKTEVGAGVGNEDLVHVWAQHADVGTLAGTPASLYASGKFHQSHGTPDGKMLFLGAEPVDTDSRLYDPGAAYELFANARWGDLSATLRALDLPENRDLPRPDGTERNLSNFAELAWDARPATTLSTRVTVSGDWWRQRKDIRNGDASTPRELLTGGFDAPVRQFDEYRGASTVLLDWFPTADHRFTLGGEVEWSDYQDSSRLAATENGKRIIPFHALGGSLFAQYEWWIASWLSLVGGGRYTGSDVFDASVDPKGALRIQPFGDDSFQIKYVFQKAFLHPSAFQRNALVTIPPGSPLTPDDVPELQKAQRNIDNERLTSHDLQLLWQPLASLGFSVTGFHRRLDSLISYNARFDVPPPRTFVNLGDVVSWGAEAEVHGQWARLQEEVNVSWAHAEFEAGRYGLLGAADAEGNLLSYPELMANVITRYHLGHGASLAAIVRIVGAADYFATGTDQGQRITHSSDVNADLDLNLRWEDAGVDGLTLALTAVNVLDDAVRRPLAANPGTAFPERLSVYASAAYRF